jgi:hypothetical protein
MWAMVIFVIVHIYAARRGYHVASVDHFLDDFGLAQLAMLPIDLRHLIGFAACDGKGSGNRSPFLWKICFPHQLSIVESNLALTAVFLAPSLTHLARIFTLWQELAQRLLSFFSKAKPLQEMVGSNP